MAPKGCSMLQTKSKLLFLFLSSLCTVQSSTLASDPDQFGERPPVPRVRAMSPRVDVDGVRYTNSEG